MMEKQDQIKDILDSLNKAVQLDNGAMHSLITNRIPCSQDFAKDSILVCMGSHQTPNEYASVTALGLLNGVLEDLGYPKVAASYQDGKFLGFIMHEVEK